MARNSHDKRGYGIVMVRLAEGCNEQEMGRHYLPCKGKEKRGIEKQRGGKAWNSGAVNWRRVARRRGAKKGQRGEKHSFEKRWRCLEGRCSEKCRYGKA